MASTRRTNPLKAILSHFATQENRTDLLRTCHAVLTTAMVQSAAEKGQGASKKGYKAECYAEAIALIEEELGQGAESAFIQRKQTILTTPQGMPNGLIRTHDSRSSTPTP
jgi:hypothetical protein